MNYQILLIGAATAALLTAAPGVLAVSQAPDPALRELLRDAVNDSTSFPDEFEGQVWLTDMANRLGTQVKDPDEKVLILTQVHWEANRAGLPPEMILAVIDIESAFDAYAVSSAGAQGLMQVMPFWLDEIGLPGDRLVDIRTNLRMGVTILKYYYDMESGDWIRALGRYNGSLGSRVYPEKVLNRLASRWFQG
jgi:soluble lytic murein transglycosylase-like protein